MHWCGVTDLEHRLHIVVGVDDTFQGRAETPEDERELARRESFGTGVDGAVGPGFDDVEGYDVPFFLHDAAETCTAQIAPAEVTLGGGECGERTA